MPTGACRRTSIGPATQVLSNPARMVREVSELQRPSVSVDNSLGCLFCHGSLDRRKTTVRARVEGVRHHGKQTKRRFAKQFSGLGNRSDFGYPCNFLGRFRKAHNRAASFLWCLGTACWFTTFFFWFFFFSKTKTPARQIFPGKPR